MLVVTERVSILLDKLLRVDFSKDVFWPEDQLCQVLSRDDVCIGFQEFVIGRRFGSLRVIDSIIDNELLRHDQLLVESVLLGFVYWEHGLAHLHSYFFNLSIEFLYFPQ